MICAGKIRNYLDAVDGRAYLSVDQRDAPCPLCTMTGPIRHPRRKPIGYLATTQDAEGKGHPLNSVRRTFVLGHRTLLTNTELGHARVREKKKSAVVNWRTPKPRFLVLGRAREVG